MKARDIMTTDHLWAASATSDVRQVAQMLAEHDIGAVPVLDDQGRMEGIITDRDICIRVVAQGRSFETPVRDVMSKLVHTIHPDAGLDEVERVMEQYRVRRLPVIDENNVLQGFISVADLAHSLRGMFKERKLADVLEAVSSPI